MAALALSANTVELTPTDDIWVYPHATDQVSDPYLRAWGGPEGAVSPPDFGNFNFSCSLVRFKLPEDITGELKEAKLIITGAPGTVFLEEDSKAAPLEARKTRDGFTEKGWTFGKAIEFTPVGGPEEIFGTGVGNPPADDEEFKIEINLLANKGVFAEELKKALASDSKTLALALTTRMDPESADGMTYKFFSRSADKKEQRPTLKLTFG